MKPTLEIVFERIARVYGARLIDLADELRLFGMPEGLKFANVYGEDGALTDVLVCYFACGESRAAMSFRADDTLADLETEALRTILNLRAFEDGRVSEVAELEKLVKL
jgi:hypothetical protein